MGNIDFSVTTETSTVSFTSDFREDGKPFRPGTPTLHGALTDSIARIAGAFNIAGALEREVAKLQPLFDAFNGAGVADVTPEPAEEHTAVPKSWLAKDYGVANMTPGEVQRLLEQRDRHNAGLRLDKEKLIANLRASEHTSRAKEADLVIRRRNIEDLEGQVAELRSLNGQQGTEIHRLQETNGLKDAELGKLRSAVEGLQRLNEGLKNRNDNQSKTIRSMQERLEVFEAGAPGVADLQTRYSGLRIDISDAADDHTRLQEERDIAREERDQKTRELKDLQAVHEDLTEQFNDARTKLNTQAMALKEDFSKALADAVDAVKERIADDLPSSTWILKSAARMHVNEILKRVAPDAIQ